MTEAVATPDRRMVLLALVAFSNVTEPTVVDATPTTILPLKVFAPANVCAAVVTTPPNEAFAGSTFRVEPEIVKAFALGVEPIAASVVMAPRFVAVIFRYPIYFLISIF